MMSMDSPARRYRYGFRMIRAAAEARSFATTAARLNRRNRPRQYPNRETRPRSYRLIRRWMDYHWMRASDRFDPTTSEIDPCDPLPPSGPLEPTLLCLRETGWLPASTMEWSGSGIRRTRHRQAAPALKAEIAADTRIFRRMIGDRIYSAIRVRCGRPGERRRGTSAKVTEQEAESIHERKPPKAVSLPI